MARIDQQLALFEFFGGQSYTTTSAISAGDNTCTVSTSGIGTGNYILINPQNFENGVASTNELVQVQSVSSNSVTLAQPTDNAYPVGSTLAPLVSSPSTVFPWLKAVVNGDLMDLTGQWQPALYINAQKSKEERQYAQKKLIDYQVKIHLVKMIPGTLQGDGGPFAVNTFYSWLDQIADRIRTEKTLITSTYPKGAAMKFGEKFTIAETHQRIENEVFMIAEITVQSVEQVNA